MRPPGHVETVLGPLPADALGVTLAHEHLFIDGRAYRESPTTDEARRAAVCEISRETRELVARFSCVNPANLVLDSYATALSELRRFRSCGGRTLIDVTPNRMGGQPEQVRRLARATSVNVILGCGPYCEYALTPEVAKRDIDEIMDGLVRDLDVGIDGTSVRAGVIGEVGINGQRRGERTRSCNITEVEERGLRAAARVSIMSGVRMIVHQPNVPDASRAIVAILEEEQVDPRTVCLGHMSSVLDLDLHYELARRGYWIGYDNFGMNMSNGYIADARDERRVAWLIALLQRGVGDRILISQDVWSKIQLVRYGGGGYTHIQEMIVPWLKREGVNKGAIRKLLVDNPRNFLAQSADLRASRAADRDLLK